MDDLREKVIRPVKGYEGYYEVDNTGRIFSIDRDISVRNGEMEYFAHIRGKELSQHKHTNGYMMVNLTKEGKCKSVRAHRIVAEAFLPNEDNLPIVNHKDEDKTNNKAENLEWCTHRYNFMYNGANKRAGDTKRGRTLTREHKEKISNGVKEYFETHESALKGRHRVNVGGKYTWLI